jgi:hypothetical protein
MKTNKGVVSSFFTSVKNEDTTLLPYRRMKTRPFFLIGTAADMIMAKEKITRRQKDVSRLLREKKGHI